MYQQRPFTRACNRDYTVTTECFVNVCVCCGCCAGAAGAAGAGAVAASPPDVTAANHTSAQQSPRALLDGDPEATTLQAEMPYLSAPAQTDSS